MRRTRLALFTSLVWLVAAAAALAIVVFLGAGTLALGTAVLPLAGALAISLLLGARAEAGFEARLATLGKAVGLRDDEARSMEAIAANLCARLERTHAIKTAFAGMRQPAAVLTRQGEIVAATAGLRALRPHAVEGGSADALFGDGFLAAGGGIAAEQLLAIDDQRYLANPQPCGNGRTLLELVPAGHYIAEDDLDAFATALAGGHTSFRFDPDAVRRSVVLARLEEAFAAFDVGARALSQLLAGEEMDPAYLRGNDGFAPQVRTLNDTFRMLEDERDEAVAESERLEAKMEAVLAAIDRYREAVATLAEHADESRLGLTVAGESITRGKDRVTALRALRRDAEAVLSDATMTAERARLSADGVDKAAGEIDALVGAIEEVSFRTNLLALNAAVEAARAGEKGAGFAVVADEVRTLAQATQQTAREIRALVGTGRAHSAVGVGEAAALGQMLEALGRHLGGVGEETDRIAGALDEGSGAMMRLDTHVGAVGSEAARALLLPRRRASAEGAGR